MSLFGEFGYGLTPSLVDDLALDHCEFLRVDITTHSAERALA